MSFLNFKDKKDILRLKKEISKLDNNIYFQTYPIHDLEKVKYLLTKSNTLPKTIDPIPYQKYVRRDKNKLSTVFPNLSGDVKLVIPIKPYPTIYSFAKKSTEREWLALFNNVVKNFKKEDKFISTHGHGVSWLHVRIERYPKYYKLDPFGNLIYKQLIHFEYIYSELKRENRKTSHWNWWVFPTEKVGHGNTYIEKKQIKELLELTDLKMWNKIIELIISLIKKYGLENVIPAIDIGRIEYFLELFLSVNYKKYDYFFDTLKEFKTFF